MYQIMHPKIKIFGYLTHFDKKSACLCNVKFTIIFSNHSMKYLQKFVIKKLDGKCEPIIFAERVDFFPSLVKVRSRCDWQSYRTLGNSKFVLH